MDLHVLKSPEYEKYIFSGSSVNSIIQKQIIAETLNLVHYISITLMSKIKVTTSFIVFFFCG